LLEAIQYRILKSLSRRFPERTDGATDTAESKLLARLGDDLAIKIRGKCVVDYGCGGGEDSVELARLGAREVVGIDIRDSMLRRARQLADKAGLGSRCRFVPRTDVRADMIVCLDSFEHFADPAADLNRMEALLVPGGIVEISFGPTWYHPLGGHLFSVIPWAHLLFSEKALIRWRSDVRSDGARRFGEVEGGLNQMTIRRFEQLIGNSSFRILQLRCVPIRPLRRLHCRLSREFTTSVVRCTLRKQALEAENAAQERFREPSIDASRTQRLNSRLGC
jgi:SAM-dependent methyltransferase